MLATGAGALGRHHFAFLRALLDGITLERAWERYLAFAGVQGAREHRTHRLRQILELIEQGGRLRGCQVQVGTLSQALRALPELQASPRDPRPAPTPSPAGSPTPAAGADPRDPAAVPTLQAWRDARCAATGVDDDFHSEAEWLALYVDEFGPVAATGSVDPASDPSPPEGGTAPALPLSATAHARRGPAPDAASRPTLSAASRRRVLEALGTLESLLARPATLADDTACWLGTSLPQELARVGVRSLGDLVAYINLHGYRWHRRVGRLGIVRADRLLQWLIPIAQAHGQPIQDHARRPPTDLALLRQQDTAPRGGADRRFALVPIVDDRLPDELSGRQGVYRSEQTNLWGAETDLQAITQWLSRYRGQTLRDYTRVAERFYLWCIHVRRKAVSSLQESDLQAYQAFLAAPPADWVQQRKVRRDDPAWRPFRGALGRNSQRHDFTVIGSLYGALLAKGYLRANVMDGLGRSLGLLQPTVDVRRSFDAQQWAFLKEVLLSRPVSAGRTRLELLLELGSTTGLRLSELATTRMRSLRQEIVDGAPAWVLDVIGKGGKQRTVVVLDHVRRLLERHHRDMDLAGVGFDPAVAGVQVPGSLPRTSAGERAASATAQVSELAHLQAALESEALQGWRPLIGMLRKPPPRRRLDRLGLPFVDREASTQADRYGALERSAIYKSLRRFFHEVAEAAAARRDAPPATAFVSASTHWLRHTFANAAVKQMQPQVVQALMGHADLRVTSAYVKADATDIVRGMRTLHEAQHRSVMGAGTVQRTPIGSAAE